MGEATNGTFSDLYPQAAPAVYAWVSLHLHQALRPLLDPEDVLQEISCRAFEQFRTYDPLRGPFRGWVFGIARNVMKEALRMFARDPTAAAGRRLTTAWVRNVPDEATSITRRVARDDAVRSFLDRLDFLAAEDRRLLIHRGLEGLEHVEVARLLNLSTDVATKRWQRLKEKLRERGLPPQLLAE